MYFCRIILSLFADVLHSILFYLDFYPSIQATGSDQEAQERLWPSEGIKKGNDLMIIPFFIWCYPVAASGIGRISGTPA